MNITDRVTALITPSLEALGYHIVLIKLADGARRKTLTIMAERKDEQGMSFDDCTQISNTASALLEVDDPITSAYDLEVCSPGIDRPLTRLADFSRFAGQEAKIETLIPHDGRKRFRGTIGETKGEDIEVIAPEGTWHIAYSNIRTAKLAVVNEPLNHPKQKKGKKS
ncbi:MAG: ribosome maturation factor RimP [Rickettsiales bacterium]|nr:ribosome maturation factor RimP [Rickettsiales bacterium]